ncbi:prepilin-type N-terminal cleavage/methylation domain-containing protein [Candidatus Sumerlaeota bacterium]|nr:prepilin-type N-terminal cleavage/methylation domain-containing protein [Candidatus Sumerlaeota bacterium]
MKTRAFTLIELLVVVAIISILAAIAVPNFLDAMTRSKVVKTKSDLRTITTALETYRVDTNWYPPDINFGVKTFAARLKNLTTPIAYMSSLPSDPFMDFAKARQFVSATGKTLNPYTVDGGINSPAAFPLTYDFAFRRTPNGGYEPDSVWARITTNPSSVLWALRGTGPDRWPSWLGELTQAYDPTNGTVSRGNIIWTGPGKGEDRPLIGG